MESIKYRTSKPISLNGAHDITICAYSIKGGTHSCIDLVNCYNIHITQCVLANSKKLGINLTGCANILIDSCCVTDVATGIQSLNGVNIQVKNNKIDKLRAKGALVKFEHTSLNVAAMSSYAVNNCI